MAFSKVNDALLEDDEDEREAAVSQATQLFDAAQTAHKVKGSTLEVLGLFRAAEDPLGDVLEGGHGHLGTLRPKELEMVLKGRLYQAAILSQLQDAPERWPEVKALVEDVLTFDRSNCHALWLRGIALLYGENRTRAATDEMAKAVDAAKAQGKHSEAEKWAGELQKALDFQKQEERAEEEMPEELEEVPPPDEGERGGTTSSSVPPAEPPVSASQATAQKLKGLPKDAKEKEKPSASGLRGGFFTKAAAGPTAAATKQRRQEDATAPMEALATGATASSSSGAKKPGWNCPKCGEPNKAERRRCNNCAAERAESQAAEEFDGQLDLRRRQTERNAALEELRRALESEKARTADLRQKETRATAALAKRRQGLEGSLQALSEELEHAMCASGSKARHASGPGAAEEGMPLVDRLDSLKTTAARIAEAVAESKELDAADQRQQQDFALELTTLRQMTSQSDRPQQDGLRQHCTDLKKTSESLAELKTQSRSLREHLKSLGSSAEAGSKDGPDPSKLEAEAEATKAMITALPFSAKFQVLCSDGEVVKILFLVFLLGCLLALALLSEGFRSLGCRFACLARP
eukprot:TRINITY_DN11166_c0_g1_i2.p1 TRINITY_DN11166_c0_g1~~TRINITY_DN11166_c0_g1_i2.p1  ORF type:complete len:618 (+),score=170.94 TRINITY_DN11166_c0_g1_i2:115-1854(+)